MNPRTFTSALAAVALTGTVSAKVYELPRSTAATPVQALITCNAPTCEVAEHCARYDQWDNITDADFSKVWTLERNQALVTPKRASGNLLCAVSIREGATSIRPLRYYRERDDAGNWRSISMTRDWGLREMSSPESPATDVDFYRLVEGKKLCLDGCGESDEYFYFKASVWFDGGLGLFPKFTHFKPGEGTLKGEWEYEKSTETSGTLTLNYDDPNSLAYAFTCWFTLEFETDESGTYDATCDDQNNATGKGPWIVTGR